MQRIAAATARATAFTEVVSTVLDDVCSHTGWPVGHALARESNGPLRTSGIWHLDDPTRYQELVWASRTMIFPDGIGLPGRVAASGQPAWIMDVTRDSNFPRAAYAVDLGVHAAFSFPVIAAGKVAAVLEFFSPEALEPDQALLDVMATVGTLLGGLIERERAGAALQRSELRFRSVVETANDAIISVDGDGRIVFWNHRAQHLFGWREDEMLGQRLSRVMPERFREAHERGLRRVGRGGERHVIGRTVELAGLHRDGREFPVELTLASWSEGAATFFTGIVRDISQRKAAEEELRLIAARLEASERRATEASLAKSAFLASMSHELRTPLNAILGFVQLMRRDGTLSPSQLEHLDIILQSGEHLLGLINDVLSIAKIEAGHVALTEIDFDLGALVHGVRDLLTSRARAKGLALVLEESGELPRVRGDEAKLRQVIINLVGNAIKFTGEGSVTLRASWADGAARLEVEDTGRGIDAHELERIFEPFVQGSASAGEGGTGLGLAISRSFLRAMRAELCVQSTAQKGSRFWFALELPRAAAGEVAAPERRIVGLAPGQAQASVLVVENDRDSRELLLRLLGTVGYQVHVAIDGLAGVAAWNEQEPGLVLMDMRMPVMDGYTATRRIRQLEHELRRPRTPILALTASAFDHDRPEIFAAGCDDIVAKPFREGPLLEIVARALGVRYRYQEEETAPPPTTELGPRLRSLPRDELEALHAALARGDDIAAQQAAERLAERDAWAAAEVTRMIRGFQLDELLAALESS